MKIKSEKEILKPDVIKKLIEEIEGPENRKRKDESYRRYQCFKDQTVRYVVSNLLKQFKHSTVVEMQYALSNISFTRKIVDKLARVYNNGVQRTLNEENATGENDKNTEQILQVEKKLKLNANLKTTNRFLKLQKLVTLYIKPCPVYDNGPTPLWSIKPETLQPHLFDVVEDYYDKTKALAYILSDYHPVADEYSKLDPGVRSTSPVPVSMSDGRDQMIADHAEDKNRGNKHYIIWTKNYHFTVDQNGTILKDEKNKDNKNPFGIAPLVTYAIDQDGSFWPQGGNDLVDGSILLNSMITHINHVGVTQGYGQLVVTGEGIPGVIEVGPSKAITLEHKEDQPTPTANYITANPPISDLRGLVEMYVALLLTTNNLSTTGVATQLSGGASLPSGIALVIDKAESLEDVQDQRQVFADNEPEIFEIVRAITDTYRSALVEEWKEVVLPKDIKKKLNVKFLDAQAIMSEKERLDTLKMRREMGLDSLLDTIMRDDPSMTKKQAEVRLEELLRATIEEEIRSQKIREELGAPTVEMTEENMEEGDPNEMIRNPNPETVEEKPLVSRKSAKAYESKKGIKPKAKKVVKNESDKDDNDA